MYKSHKMLVGTFVDGLIVVEPLLLPDEDCSGLVMWCYAQAGVSLDHYSGSQGQSGAIIPLSQAQPGDILWKSGHVGIYIGNGQYIHAPQTGDVVKIASNVSRFTCAVRPY